jgi:hypothetical protein
MGIVLQISLEPFAEIERALLVVKVLELPRPQLGGHLGVGDGSEHYLRQKLRSIIQE